jgi:hypothetical protein
MIAPIIRLSSLKGRGRSLEVKKDVVPVLARKQPFLSMSSRRHQRVLSASNRTDYNGYVRISIEDHVQALRGVVKQNFSSAGPGKWPPCRCPLNGAHRDSAGS